MLMLLDLLARRGWQGYVKTIRFETKTNPSLIFKLEHFESYLQSEFLGMLCSAIVRGTGSTAPSLSLSRIRGQQLECEGKEADHPLKLLYLNSVHFESCA